MIHSNLVPQKKKIIIPNKIYFKTLNQTGWECFENATSNSRLIVLLIAIHSALIFSTKH
jgi:hypothetical protein